MIAATPQPTVEPVERTPDGVAETDATELDAANRLYNIGLADAAETLKRETAARATTPSSEAKPAELKLAAFRNNG